MQATTVVASDGPRFELVYGPSLTVTRRSAPASEITAALFFGGASRSFVDNVMHQNGINIREGEWVMWDATTALLKKATPFVAPVWPIWQDPGAGGAPGRFDAPTGGVTFAQGLWTAATNMITDGFHDGDTEFSVGGLYPGQELKVAVLPVSHKYAGLVGLGPINFDDGVNDATNTVYCVAHVEQVLETANVVVITNYQARYQKTITQALTTLVPTTPAPSTPAPTTLAPTTP